MDADQAAACIAAAIGEPARARMLYALLDGHARTSTELAALAAIGAPAASTHLQRLRRERLVTVAAEGRYRYYRLHSPTVARTLENLTVLAGARAPAFRPSTPPHLLFARTCYDHLAGRIGVQLHDRCRQLGWLSPRGRDYRLTSAGADGVSRLGLDVAALQAQRRRFAFACLDWSERRPHLGGALAAALLTCMLEHRWFQRHLDSRALDLTRLGRRKLPLLFGVQMSTNR